MLGEGLQPVQHECQEDYYIYIERTSRTGFTEFYERHALLTPSEAKLLEGALVMSGRYRTVDIDSGGEYYTIGYEQTLQQIADDTGVNEEDADDD